MRILKILKEKGLFYIINTVAKRFVNCILCPYYLLKSRTFKFQNQSYKYFYHFYGKGWTTWTNERTVEVPIIWRLVNEYMGKNILEVGNVLSNFFFVNHDILDKYEKAKGIINQDIIDFKPSKKYDLIVSISTLEHVGWDEEPTEPKKILLAIENLKKIITPKGKIIVTLPIGQNYEMDKLIKKNKIKFNKKFCLKRISTNNKWIEVDWEEIKDIKYNEPYPNANGIIIGEII